MRMYIKRSIALRLAHQLRKTGLSFSDSQTMAWAWINSNGASCVTFKKVSGEVTTRVVATQALSQYIDFKGTGTRIKEGLRLFVDVAKLLTGQKNPVISAYQNSIISILA